MWFLLLILSFTSAELVDPDDNIAMESRPQAQALYYKGKYPKSEYYYRAEEEDNHDYDSDDYHTYAKHPKKYQPQSDKVNIYINKNYANRAREPREEGWRPMSSQSEEDERLVKHYHFDSHPKAQKQIGYYSDGGSKKTKKYEESYTEHHNQAQRYKPQPTQAAQTHYDDQYRQPDQSQQQGQILQLPSMFLQQIEEETKSGKMLGFASLIEHFSAEDDAEEMKAALQEGSLDDIKRTVPKSGMVFKIFQDDGKVPMTVEEIPSNNLDQIEFKPSASTYYAKPVKYKDESLQKPILPNRVPLQSEKKKNVKQIKIPQVPPPKMKDPPQSDYDDGDATDDMKFHDEDMREEEKQPEMMMMMIERPLPKPMPMQQERPQPKPVQMNEERPRPKPRPQKLEQERPHRPQQIEQERPHRPQQIEQERPHRPQQMEQERPHRPQQMEQERPHRPQQMEHERPHRPQQIEQERPHRPQQMEQERPRPRPRPRPEEPPSKSQERPKYPKKTQTNHDNSPDSKPSSGESSRYTPVLQKASSYAQIEAASKQRYRPIQQVLNDNDDYNYYHRDNYPSKNSHRYQEGQESQQQYQTTNPDGYSNHKWISSGSTSETEIRTPGGHVEATVDHSSPVKAPQSSKYYYDHFKSQSSNHKPEAFDHSKALKGSLSFNAGNIIGNHNYGKQEDVETTRTPIQFVSESEATPKFKLPNSDHKHLKQHVQKYAETLFKNMYKIKDDEEDSSNKITSPRHQYSNQVDQTPRPAALVSVKLPHFDAETPMMTEDEFQYKFGHLPVVTTPKSYYLSTISTPLREVIELKPTKPQAEALTQYWTIPERESYKSKIPSTDDYHQQSIYKPSALKLQANHYPTKNPSTKYSEIAGEASNNNYKNAKGQIERPSTNWKDGQIYLTKDYQGKLSDLYIKTSDKENVQHFGYSNNERPSRPKKMVVNAELVPHVHDIHSPKKSKYDISLLPSYRLQKRGDKDEESSKNVALVSENNRKGNNVKFPPLETGFKPMFHGGKVEREPEHKKSTQKQGVILLGSDDRDNRQFSVSASYQIHRRSENGEK